MANAAALAQPVDLFYSYAHEDEALREELDSHLALLRRRGVLRTWHDGRIQGGEEWRASIAQSFLDAEIVLLLVSASFIDSDFCYGVEMRDALERHAAATARVIPVIVRPLDWEDAPFAKLQALPKGAKAVTTWPNRDEAWTDVAMGIRRVAAELRARRAPGPTPPEAPPFAPAPGPVAPAPGAFTPVPGPIAPAQVAPPPAQVAPPPAPRPMPPAPRAGAAAAQDSRMDAALERVFRGFDAGMKEAMRHRAMPPSRDAHSMQSMAEKLASAPGQPRILWVDHVPDNNAHEVATLRRLQIDVVACTSTEAALALLAAAPRAPAEDAFDLVISNWLRPGARDPERPEGLRLLGEVRALGLELPIVFYYGKTDHESKRERAQAAGALGATYRPDELFELVARALHGAR